MIYWPYELLLMFGRNPYYPGNKLSLQIESYSSELVATVVKAFEPFTLSCVLVVQLDYPQLGLVGKYALKLYDRRFATQLREDEVDYPWDQQVEEEFRKFVLDGHASVFFDHCAKQDAKDRIALDNYALGDRWTDVEGENWSRAQTEAYLQYLCRKFYETELKVYNRLQDIQGQCIPYLEGRVMLKSSQMSPQLDTYLGCPGLLLEYIEGVSLKELAQAPPEQGHVLREVGKEAIRIVNYISAYDIRNEDVQLRSFIVRENPVTKQLKPFMIDFGDCVLRSPGQSDYSWESWKAEEDEEGAIGVMLQKYAGPSVFEYIRSPERAKLQNKYMSEAAMLQRSGEPLRTVVISSR